METFVITGGRRLQGSVRLGGAKNASFKLMIASLLAQGESRLLNVPHINDVEVTRSIIQQLGGQVSSAGERMLRLECSNLVSSTIPLKFGELSRASTMFVGPLLHRFGKAKLPLPGGDKIGRRPLERHFAGLIALGATIESKSAFVEVYGKNLKGTTYRFEKNTHTGTETMLMAAVHANGKTILENAALEPEVDDLIEFLNEMGAKVKRKIDRRIEIIGVKNFKPAIHKIMIDRNEAVSYACAALSTRGDVVVENAKEKYLEAFLEKVEDAGGGYEVGNFGIRFFYKGKLQATDVVTSPHPGFMSDWQPLWAVLMTQAQGKSTIHEAVHTSRFQYVKDLNSMGATIESFQPHVEDPKTFYNFNLEDDKEEILHAIRIFGDTPLSPTTFSVHDLRAGATLVLASLIASGQSTITGVDHIDRGYENLDGRLIDLGANIKRS